MSRLPFGFAQDKELRNANFIRDVRSQVGRR